MAQPLLNSPPLSLCYAMAGVLSLYNFQASCEVNNKDSHTGETAIKDDQESQARLLQLGQYVYSHAHIHCASWNLQFGCPAAEVWRKKTSRFPRQHYYPGYQPQALTQKKGEQCRNTSHLPFPVTLKAGIKGFILAAALKLEGFADFLLLVAHT